MDETPLYDAPLFPSSGGAALAVAHAGRVRSRGPALGPNGIAVDCSPSSRAEAARQQLLAVVSELRDVWAEVIEMSPVLAARFNAAARLANNAAAALQAEMIT